MWECKGHLVFIYPVHLLLGFYHFYCERKNRNWKKIKIKKGNCRGHGSGAKSFSMILQGALHSWGFWTPFFALFQVINKRNIYPIQVILNADLLNLHHNPMSLSGSVGLVPCLIRGTSEFRRTVSHVSIVFHPAVRFRGLSKRTQGTKCHLKGKTHGWASLYIVSCPIIYHAKVFNNQANLFLGHKMYVFSVFYDSRVLFSLWLECKQWIYFIWVAWQDELESHLVMKLTCVFDSLKKGRVYSRDFCSVWCKCHVHRRNTMTNTQQK